MGPRRRAIVRSIAILNCWSKQSGIQGAYIRFLPSVAARHFSGIPRLTGTSAERTETLLGVRERNPRRGADTSDFLLGVENHMAHNGGILRVGDLDMRNGGE